MVGHLGAVDIGASKVLVAIADDDGRLQAGALVRFGTPDEPEALVGAIAEALASLGASPAAIGCVAPGPLDQATGTLVRLHNRNWEDVAFGPMLAARTGAVVVLEDDATAAALGEAHHGAGAGCDPVAYLTVSSGVGAGIVVDGASFRGAHGLAGEVGHLVIDPSGPLCGCGRRGDVESYAGGLSLVRRAIEAQLIAAGDGPMTADVVFTRARGGDDVAARLVADATHAVSFAVAALAAVVDPECLVVGGSVALGQPHLVKVAAEGARALVMAETGATIDVRRAALGERSALAGAAVLGARLLGG